MKLQHCKVRAPHRNAAARWLLVALCTFEACKNSLLFGSSVCTLKLKVMMLGLLGARNFTAVVGDFRTAYLQAPTVQVQAVEPRPPVRRMPAKVNTLGRLA